MPAILYTPVIVLFVLVVVVGRLSCVGIDVRLTFAAEREEPSYRDSESRGHWDGDVYHPIDGVANLGSAEHSSMCTSGQLLRLLRSKAFSRND